MEARGPISTLRKAFSRRMRYVWYLAKMNLALPRLLKLQGSKKGKRVFLLANGPSLAKLDLSHLKGEDVCVVNMGLRALDSILPHVTIHVATDKNRYVRFAEDIEDYALRYDIPLRFFGIWGRKTWKRLPKKGSVPYFMVVGHKSIFERGFKSAPYLGYGSCGTVMIIALQILYFLGYDEVYVAGVDLDYGGEQPYFYAMTGKDNVHEADQKVQARRPLMDNANEEFAFARVAFEQNGRLLANAGVGGNLNSLPRVEFNSLFPAKA
jgi:hypothetical protein